MIFDSVDNSQRCILENQLNKEWVLSTFHTQYFLLIFLLFWYFPKLHPEKVASISFVNMSLKYWHHAHNAQLHRHRHFAFRIMLVCLVSCFLFVARCFCLELTNVSGRIHLAWNKSIRDGPFPQVWKHRCYIFNK